MKTITPVHCLILSVLLVAGHAFCHAQAPATGDTEERLIPLTVNETADALTAWWRDKALQIRRMEPATGHIELHATGNQSDWRVRLAPHSPVATRITVSVSGQDPSLERQQLWNHISRYIHSLSEAPPPPPDNRIPVSVLSKIESVVCITARSDRETIQFSGFVVDTDGLVLCTAHNLERLPELTVTLYDGRHATGRILHKSSVQDLALLHMALTTDTAISLTAGRNLLGMGERVFTVGCPVRLGGTIYAGTINGPPRRVGDFPLWQVNMEIHPGSSGSPVFDSEGNLVGMVKGRYRGTTTLGFLTPLETIINFLKENRPQ